MGIPSAANADENTMGDSDSGKAMGLETVHFAYDSYTLDEAGKVQLKANAQILKDKPSLKIQIEGHCVLEEKRVVRVHLRQRAVEALPRVRADLGDGDGVGDLLVVFCGERDGGNEKGKK